MDIQERIKEISEEGELWRPCPEFENKYLISSHGRILGIGTDNACKKGKLLKQHKKKGKNGYMQIRLYDNNRAKTIEVHLLVAKAFIPNQQNLPVINHIDEDKTNNHMENLEWCTNQYNIRYSGAKKVDVYTKEGTYIETLEAIVDASIKYGIPTSNISRCCLSKDGYTRGFQFRFHGSPFVPKPPIIPRVIKRKHMEIKPREAYYVPVDEYTAEGSFVRTWPNVTSISKAYNIPTTNISKCCKGIIKTAYGKIFLPSGADINTRLQQLKERKHKSKSEYVR